MQADEGGETPWGRESPKAEKKIGGWTRLKENQVKVEKRRMEGTGEADEDGTLLPLTWEWANRKWRE